MNINYNTKARHRLISTLAPGVSFCWEGSVGMVTDGRRRTDHGDNRVYTVNLETGEEGHFSPNFVVQDTRRPEVSV